MILRDEGAGAQGSRRSSCSSEMKEQEHRDLEGQGDSGKGHVQAAQSKEGGDGGCLQKGWLNGLTQATMLTSGCCLLLTLQNSSYTLLRRYSSGVLHEQATSQSILAVGEILKGAFCAVMVFRGNEGRCGKRETTGDTHDEGLTRAPSDKSLCRISKKLIMTSGPMVVPAVIFLAMNLLSFVALRRISASAFTLIQQSKIIFTAVLSRLFLSRVLSYTKWRALVTLVCALVIICIETKPSHSPASTTQPISTAPVPLPDDDSRRWLEYSVGIAAVSVESFLSGLSNVYFEKVLKSTPLSLWERNVQLACYSLLIYVPMAFHAHPTSILFGWSWVTWVVAALSALGGILVGLILNYMDSIAKNLSLSIAIVLTTLFDHFFFNGPMNVQIVASTGVVIISILNYTSG